MKSDIFTPKILLLVFLIIFLCVLNLELITVDTNFINWYLTIAWTSFFPIALIGMIGAFNAQKLRLSSFNKRIDNKVIFVLPSIGRIGNLPALYRVIDSILKYAPQNLNNFVIDVVTEENSEANLQLTVKYKNNPNVRLVRVPSHYRTKNGTKYKARANQYSADLHEELGEVNNETWTYHLDDDTAIGSDTISSIAEVIYNDDYSYHIAQGILTFPFQNSSSLICKLADSVRPTDDVTKFYFFTKFLKTPLSGIHGEHLLIRSSIENYIGWDFGPNAITEDAEFALNFSYKFPKKSIFLKSATYGASPSTISDFIKQRRRWSKGLIDLVFRAKVPLLYKLPIGYMVFTWASGIFQNIFFIFLVLLLSGQNNTSPISEIFGIIWSVNFAYQIWQYIEGLRINLQVSNKLKLYPLYLILIIPGIFLFSLLESFSTFLGLWDYITKKKGFIVIEKPA